MVQKNRDLKRDVEVIDSMKEFEQANQRLKEEIQNLTNEVDKQKLRLNEEKTSKIEIYFPEKGVNHLAIMKMFGGIAGQKIPEREDLIELYKIITEGHIKIHVDKNLGNNEIEIDGIRYHKSSVEEKHRRKGKNDICYTYSPEVFIGRCEDDDCPNGGNSKKENSQGERSMNLIERLELIEKILKRGDVELSEFQDKMKPDKFIRFVHGGGTELRETVEDIVNEEGDLGTNKNWDRHIKWRHSQYTKKKNGAPKYLEKYGELAGWEENDPFPPMLYGHNELANPPNLNRSEHMVRLMESVINLLQEKQFENVETELIWEDGPDGEGRFVDMDFEEDQVLEQILSSPWVTGESCKHDHKLLNKSS